MPPASTKQLESLLRASITGATEPATTSGDDDPVARRVALYADLLRLAPPSPPDSTGRLLWVDASNLLHVTPVTKESIDVGRGSSCAVKLTDPEVSRRHCCVTATQAGVRLEDRGSTNGTWLNGQLVGGKVALHDGDVIRLGATLLVFAQP